MGLHVSLTPELERRIREKVASGLYENASEVIRDALRAYFARPSEAEGMAFAAGGVEAVRRRGGVFPISGPRFA